MYRRTFGTEASLRVTRRSATSPAGARAQSGNKAEPRQWRFGLRHLAFCTALVLLMFSNDESNAVLFQIAGVLFVAVSAGAFFLTAPFRKITVSFFDAIMLLSVILSYLAAAIWQDMYVLLFTTTFLAAYLSFMIIAQYTTNDELIACIQVSIIVILAIVLVVFGSTLVSTLAPGAARRWELRQAPFGMHPNLAGFVYGGFVIMIANSRFNIMGWNAAIKISIIAICLAVMVAASSRGGMFALVLTLAIYVSTEIAKGGRGAIKYLIPAGFIGALLGVVFLDQILGYATEMLDLNSKERGLESGGTGRVDIWLRGMAFIANRTWDLFLGSGMRSATFASLGFPTESSYINLTIESGLCIMLAIFLSFIFLILHSYRRQARGDGFYRLVFYVLLFAMFQSIFNRYLIAIGNPFSICILIIASKAFAGLKRSLLHGAEIDPGGGRHARMRLVERK